MPMSASSRTTGIGTSGQAFGMTTGGALLQEAQLSIAIVSTNLSLTLLTSLEGLQGIGVHSGLSLGCCAPPGLCADPHHREHDQQDEASHHSQGDEDLGTHHFTEGSFRALPKLAPRKLIASSTN